MKRSLFALALAALLLPATGSAQATKGSILPHSALEGGSKLCVSLPETVNEVVLEAKAAATASLGGAEWSPLARKYRNLPGSTQMIIKVPGKLRGQEVRVKVWSVRAAPQTVAFRRNNQRSQMRVTANLPAGTSLSSEYFDKVAKQWKRFATVAVPDNSEDPCRIPVPLDRRGAPLRITRLDVGTPGSESSRFPAAFRTGQTEFPGTDVTSAGAAGSSVVYASAASTMDSANAKSATTEVEESDIWKVVGTKIYFFNQLRGLQVIETANAADPEIISFLRMPAVGEEMYVLPGGRALLVRQEWTDEGNSTGLVLVDTSGPEAEILADLRIPGWYADSRLVDGRLVIATSEWNYSSWRTRSAVRVIDDLATNPRVAATADLDFAADAMGTGSDYVWVSGSKNWSWTNSRIALFALSDLPSLAEPLSTDLGGMIYDKFKIHQSGETLFAVTQTWNANWRQSTALESYSLQGKQPQQLQKLALVEGESLHATRFDGNRAYIVTFEQIDPLWIVDLSDPSNMHVESELQVPGWSTFIQPVGGFLAAVGVDGGKVTASLFDVRDPAKPSLSSRVDIGDGYTWSEANWNEKAVAIIPESGLILLPFSSFNRNGDVSAVQLVDMDTITGTLTKRGVISHAFTPRRASALREGILASISNRELLLLDASNRDNPAALAEVVLAFGADFILGSKDGMLVHAESGDWRGTAAVLRVSSATDPDSVVAQASLGGGDILAGSLQGDHLVVLLRGRDDVNTARLVRFDASRLPELVETGRFTFALDSGWNASAEIVWPDENLAVAAIRQTTWTWWGWPWRSVDDGVVTPILRSDVKASAVRPSFYSYGEDKADLYALDLASGAPTLVSSLDLEDLSPRNISKFFTADGLVVFSSARAERETQPDQQKPEAESATVKPYPGDGRVLDYTFLRIVDYSDPSTPYLWPETALPGSLEGIAEFDRTAGLLFAASNDGGLQALLYEGGLAHTISTLPESDLRAVKGRVVWTFADKSLSRNKLADDGTWSLEGTRSDLPFEDPSGLRAHADGLLANRGSTLVAVPSDFSAPLRSTTVSGWGWWQSQNLSKVNVLGDNVAVPVGEYGIELLK